LEHGPVRMVAPARAMVVAVTGEVVVVVVEEE
jgi:hypothetical protein